MKRFTRGRKPPPANQNDAVTTTPVGRDATTTASDTHAHSNDDFGFMGSPFGSSDGGMFGGGFGADGGSSFSFGDDGMFSTSNNNSSQPVNSSGAGGLSIFQSRFKKAPPAASNNNTTDASVSPAQTTTTTPSSKTGHATATNTIVTPNSASPVENHHWGGLQETVSPPNTGASQGAFAAETGSNLNAGLFGGSFGSTEGDTQQPTVKDASHTGLFPRRPKAAREPSEDGTTAQASIATADGTAWNTSDQPPQGLFPSTTTMQQQSPPPSFAATPMRRTEHTNDSVSHNHDFALPADKTDGTTTSTNIISPHTHGASQPDKILPLGPTTTTTTMTVAAPTPKPTDPMGPPPPRRPATQDPTPFTCTNDVTDGGRVGESFQDTLAVFEQNMRNADDLQTNFADALLDAMTEVNMVTAELLECYAAAMDFYCDLEAKKVQLADVLHEFKEDLEKEDLTFHPPTREGPHEMDLTSESENESGQVAAKAG